MHNLSAGVLALAVLSAPNADLIDCGNVTGRYNLALGRVIEALRTYEKCLVASDKRNDCAAEMQALDDAHDDFVDAVDDVKGCR